MTRGRKGAVPYQPVLRGLKRGEPIPEGEGHRYPASHGYVRLRWTVAPGVVVEAYEHRIVMERHLGRPLAEGEQVHHINHDSADNRIENLQLMTRAEHSVHHATENAVDIRRIASLYREGYSTTQVGQMVGLSAGQVSRRLAKAGVPARPRRAYLKADRKVVPA